MQVLATSTQIAAPVLAPMCIYTLCCFVDVLGMELKRMGSWWQEFFQAPDWTDKELELGETWSAQSLALINMLTNVSNSPMLLKVQADKARVMNTDAIHRPGNILALSHLLKVISEPSFLPLFVFDGNERPKIKRGSDKMGKLRPQPYVWDEETAGHIWHGMVNGEADVIRTRSIADAFQALSAAEADLACLNRYGVIDAILTDNVDVLVFSALQVIKNSSLTLSGNRSIPALASEGKPSKHHADTQQKLSGGTQRALLGVLVPFLGPNLTCELCSKQGSSLVFLPMSFSGEHQGIWVLSYRPS
ncbi:hypothetical protein DFH29DRAFT_876913 [Suillus ampliporus]|nr:hypothetical protein DFH29DRAFT_876913 [Suillus ampliporus]